MENIISLVIGSPCEFIKKGKAGKDRDAHRGKIVECIVRRHPLGLSEISCRVGISRRTLYNWFEKENLSMDDMMKIGLAIDYNFSKEFPGAYDNNLSGLKDQETETVRTDRGHQAVYYWMEKYISLLERYNEILNCKMDKAEN